MNKRVLVLLLGLLAVPLALNAQTANSFQIVSFDIGYAPSWVLNGSNNPVTPQLFALNVRVADNFTVGFQTYSNGTNTAPLLNMKYDFLPGKARGTLAFGKDNNLFLGTGNLSVAALGFEYIPFTRNVAGSVTTELKLGMQYLFNATDVSKGAAIFAIALGIGL